MALKFGTSGIRGLNTEYNTTVVNNYITAFHQHAQAKMDVTQMVLAGDLRVSKPGIINLIKVAQ